jgi:hypothetical protein
MFMILRFMAPIGFLEVVVGQIVPEVAWQPIGGGAIRPMQSMIWVLESPRQYSKVLNNMQQFRPSVTL